MAVVFVVQSPVRKIKESSDGLPGGALASRQGFAAQPAAEVRGGLEAGHGGGGVGIAPRVALFIGDAFG